MTPRGETGNDFGVRPTAEGSAPSDGLGFLQAELDALEAEDPELKRLGDRIRQWERYVFRGEADFDMRLQLSRKFRLRRLKAEREKWPTRTAEPPKPKAED